MVEADRSHGRHHRPAAGEYCLFSANYANKHHVLWKFLTNITGPGPHGHLFAAGKQGVVPDSLCTAKGTSGGYAPFRD